MGEGFTGIFITACVTGSGRVFLTGIFFRRVNDSFLGFLVVEIEIEIPL